MDNPWKRLLEILQTDDALSAEATEAIQEYAEDIHDVGHEFMENAEKNGVSCDQMRAFLLGLLRLGYLRARVGSTQSDGVPSEEKGCREGTRTMGHDELAQFLKGCNF